MIPFLQSHTAVRISEDGLGELHVEVDPDPEVFIGAFYGSLTGQASVKVNLGTVNGSIPTIKRVRLDGRGADGSRQDVPDLDLATLGPNDEGQSWICLQQKVDLKTGRPDPKDWEALSVVHVNDLKPWFSNGLALDVKGAGIKPICLVQWASHAAVERLHQITWFHQRHSFRPAAAGRVAVHFFTIAA